MAGQPIEIIANFVDHASAGLEKLGLNLRKIADVGLEPIAKISPTAANALGGLLDKVGPVGIGVAAIGGAAVAAVVGLTAMVKGVADTADNLRDLSIRSGASVESLSALGHAAKLAGSSTEEVAGSFRFMQRAIEGAGESAEKADAFRKLGVDLAALRAQKPEEQFAALAAAITGVDDPAKRVALALDVFGKSGTQLLPVLADVASKGLKGVTAEAEKLGIVISTDTAEAADAFNDALTNLTAVGTGLVQQLGASLLPIFVDVAEGLLAGATAVSQFLRETGLLSAAAKLLAVALFPVVEALKTIAVVASATAKALQGDFAGAATELKQRGSEFGASFGATFLGIEAGSKKTTGAIVADAKTATEALTATGPAQLKLIADLGKAQQQAAQERLVAEAAASGDSLKIIEAELAAKRVAIATEARERIAKITELKLAGIEAAEARKSVDLAALDRLVAAEVKAAEDRTNAIRGYRDTAISILEGLGAQFAEVTEKLKLGRELERLPAQLKAIEAALAEAKRPASELGAATEALIGKLKALGASGIEVAKALPEGPAKDAKLATEALANSVIRLGDAFHQLDPSGADYVRRLDEIKAAQDRVAASARALSVPLTGNSLDDDFNEVGRISEEAAAKLRGFASSMAGGIAQAVTYAFELGKIAINSAIVVDRINASAEASRQESAFLRESTAAIQASSAARSRVSEETIRASQSLREHGRTIRETSAGYHDLTRAAIAAADAVTGIRSVVAQGIPSLRNPTGINSVGQPDPTTPGAAPLTSGPLTATQIANLGFNPNQFFPVRPIGTPPGGPSLGIPALGDAMAQALLTSIPTFQAGGVVPGPRGRPRLSVVHGGETVSPEGRGGITAHEVRTIVQEVMRALPPPAHVAVALNGTTVMSDQRQLYQLSDRIAATVADRVRRGIS